MLPIGSIYFPPLWLRFFGLVAMSGVFLGWAWRTYRKGNRRFSELLNGAGVASCLATGYYARVASLFEPTVSTAIMFAAVFVAFALAASYRSLTLAYVAEILGLGVFALVDFSRSTWTSSIYLILYYAAALQLVVRLKRSALALVPWAGVLTFFLFMKRVEPVPGQLFAEITFFLAFFFLFDELDLVLLAFRRKRASGYGDLVRACLTGLICFGFFWRGCSLISQYPGYANSHIDWFVANYGYVALVFCAFFGVLWTVARRYDAARRLNENDDVQKDTRAVNRFARLRNLHVMFGVESFVFLAIALTALCSHIFAEPTCLALSIAP